MISKILWASDGSRDSNEALKYIEPLNSKFNIDVIGLYVIPDYPDRKIGGELTTEQNEGFIKWARETELKEKKRLWDIAKDFKEKGIDFRIEVVRGVPHR